MAYWSCGKVMDITKAATEEPFLHHPQRFACCYCVAFCLGANLNREPWHRDVLLSEKGPRMASESH